MKTSKRQGQTACWDDAIRAENAQQSKKWCERGFLAFSAPHVQHCFRIHARVLAFSSGWCIQTIYDPMIGPMLLFQVLVYSATDSTNGLPSSRFKSTMWNSQIPTVIAALEVVIYRTDLPALCSLAVHTQTPWCCRFEPTFRFCYLISPVVRQYPQGRQHVFQIGQHSTVYTMHSDFYLILIWQQMQKCNMYKRW